MPRYFIKLAYQGSNYHGWQSQQNASSVQDELQRCLSLKLGQRIQLTGCGRTDTGVHARVFYAHFELLDLMPEVTGQTFINKLNVFLPDDIVVFKIRRVQTHAHARFDALSRTYCYHITRKKNPFKMQYAYHLYGELDMVAMQQAADLLMAYTDFTSFSKSNTQTKTNECIITEAEWNEQEDVLVFRIKANRFLRNMVRAIVGSLIEVGQHKMNVNQFREVIEAKDRSAAGFSVPAHALFLDEVVYPAEIMRDLD